MPISDYDDLLAAIGQEGTLLHYRKGQVLFSQGDPSDAVFSIRQGKIKLTVASTLKRKAVIAIFAPGDLVGEACLADHQPVRTATATSITDCSVVRLAKPAMTRLLRDDRVFATLLLSYVLTRNARIEDDLVDQRLNLSEKRLARTLLLLADFGKADSPTGAIPAMSQETLAGLVGTTRSRVNFFMNKFCKLGFVDYARGIEVHSSLRSVVQDRARPGQLL